MLQIDRGGKPSHVAGVPPDYFSEDGQLWGNPLYDWSYHEQTGFLWWVERIRHAAQQAHLVRIDHFRGFESFWSVPYGAKFPRGGASGWPGLATLCSMALEKALGELPIVAEDLGVITPEVEALREETRHPGHGGAAICRSTTRNSTTAPSKKTASVIPERTTTTRRPAGSAATVTTHAPRRNWNVRAPVPWSLPAARPNTIHRDMISPGLWQPLHHCRGPDAGLPGPGIGCAAESTRFDAQQLALADAGRKTCSRKWWSGQPGWCTRLHEPRSRG